MAHNLQSSSVQQYTVNGISCERRGPADGTAPALIFSHGIEAGMHDGMTQDVAQGFAEQAAVVCWDGTRSLAERLAGFRTVLDAPVHRGAAAIGGRSMGARAAVTTALALPQRALVLVSWPLLAGKHGERREPERREQILLDLPAATDVLFVVGAADAQCPLGMFAEFRARMKARSWLVEVAGADHRMAVEPAQASRPLRVMTGRLAAEWLRGRDEARRYGRVEWSQHESKVLWTGWIEKLH